MTTTPSQPYNERHPRRNPQYRLTSPVRFGSLTFADEPKGSPAWYVQRAYRLRGLANHLGSVRARNRAHRAALAIADRLRSVDASAHATVLAIAVQIRTRWLSFGARYEEAA